MPHGITRDASELDFKEPLSPTPTCSRLSSTLSLPPPKILPHTSRPPTPTYGLMGGVGIVVGMVLFFLDRASDALLAYALWKQYDTERNFYLRKEDKLWFSLTVLVIAAPIVVINTLSLIWYSQNKHILGAGGVFARKSRLQKTTCVIGHLLLLGPLVRYLDILLMGKRRRKKYSVRSEMGSRASVQRFPPSEEESILLEVRTLSRDTAMLDLVQSFFQTAPQLILQVFLIYRTPRLISGHSDNLNLTLPTQLLKIMIGLFSISWYLVTYQDELRRTIQGKRQLTCGATSICLFWRTCMIASRIISIASLAALKVDGEGGLVKIYSDNAPRGAVLSFPSITAFILLGHWFLMVIWVHAQKTTYCNTERGPRIFLEFIYDLAMSWVHVFCYVNMKDTPSRRKIFFFYTLILVENTSFMIIWYMQLITKDVWLRVTVVFSVEALFVIGLSCAIGFYAFLRPSRDQLRQ